MQITPRSLGFLFLLSFTTVSAAHSSLEQARHAQALLGDGTWSQILRIENESRGGPYGRIVHALVFEFQRVLWFYTDADGTQSFSLHHDDLVAEKADFGPLLRAIDAGFTRWSAVGSGEPAHQAPGARLRNGCFIESLALWRERAARGDRLEEPRLLSYYYPPTVRRPGHTVFAFRDHDAMKLIDPNDPTEVRSIRLGLANTPLELARELGGRAVWKARFLPLEDPKAPAATLTTIG